MELAMELIMELTMWLEGHLPSITRPLADDRPYVESSVYRGLFAVSIYIRNYRPWDLDIEQLHQS